MEISKSQFKAKALEYFRRVEETGEIIIVTDHGKPKIEITAYKEKRTDPLAALKGSLTRYEEPLEPVGLEDWDALA